MFLFHLISMLIVDSHSRVIHILSVWEYGDTSGICLAGFVTIYSSIGDSRHGGVTHAVNCAALFNRMIGQSILFRSLYLPICDELRNATSLSNSWRRYLPLLLSNSAGILHHTKLMAYELRLRPSLKLSGTSTSMDHCRALHAAILHGIGMNAERTPGIHLDRVEAGDLKPGNTGLHPAGIQRGTEMHRVYLCRQLCYSMGSALDDDDLG